MVIFHMRPMMVYGWHLANDELRLDEVLSNDEWMWCEYESEADVGLLQHVVGNMPGLGVGLFWSQEGILHVCLSVPCKGTVAILELLPCYCLWFWYRMFEPGCDFGQGLELVIHHI